GVCVPATTCTTTQATSSTNVPAGGAILAAIGYYSSSAITVTGCTDTAGDIFQHGVGPSQTAGTVFIDTWYVLASAGNATNAVTCTASSVPTYFVVPSHQATYTGTASLDTPTETIATLGAGTSF